MANFGVGPAAGGPAPQGSPRTVGGGGVVAGGPRGGLGGWAGGGGAPPGGDRPGEGFRHRPPSSRQPPRPAATTVRSPSHRYATAYRSTACRAGLSWGS